MIILIKVMTMGIVPNNQHINNNYILTKHHILNMSNSFY